jgi:peroxiredoxin
MREKPSLVRTYKKRNRLTFPHLLDVQSNVSRTYGVRYTPTSFIVDKQGNIAARVVGPVSWASPEFQEMFKEMVSE